VTARFLSADEVDDALKRRLGRVHARQRLGIEKDHEAQKFGQGLTFFHFENLPVSHAIIGSILRASGTYWRGRANAASRAHALREEDRARPFGCDDPVGRP